MMTSSRKIILFNPKTSDISRRKGVLPLALLSISSKLNTEGYHIVIIDEATDSFSEEVLDGALCFGVSAMIGYQIYSALSMAKRIRKLHPGIPIVWGGWHPSIQPEQTAENDHVDYLVRGQGEETFYELIKALEQNVGFETILGLTYKRDGQIRSNPDRPIVDPNTFPHLPYELIDMPKYIHASEFGKRTINYLTSIGCPFNCGFCAEQLVHHRKWYPLTAERVLKDLAYLIHTYGIDSVVINDSEFFINEKRVVEICRGMIDTGFHIKWGNVNGRADILLRYQEETWNLMRKSGLQSILTGAETYDPIILKLINKKISIENTIDFSKRAKKFGIIIKFSMMIGLPIKDRQKTIYREFAETIDFINMLYRVNPDNMFLLFMYTPFPGTPLYNRSVELGYQGPQSLEEWGLFLQGLNSMLTPWTDEKISEIVYQVNFYFPFVSNMVHNVILGYPLLKKTVALPVERILYVIMKWRLRTKFFAFPVEYLALKQVMKWMNR